MSENNGSKLVDVIESIGQNFEEFKRVNDQRLEEERKGNEARAKELSETLEKIGDQLSASLHICFIQSLAGSAVGVIFVAFDNKLKILNDNIQFLFNESALSG